MLDIVQYALGGPTYCRFRGCGAPASVLASQSLDLVCPSEGTILQTGHYNIEDKAQRDCLRSPTEYATEIQDLLLDLPDDELSEKFKQQLIARIADSERQKLRQLLTAEELGDRKPSQLLQKMQLLLEEKARMIDSSLLRELFLQRLPANVHMILASAELMSLDNLAEMADRIIDIATATISSVSTSSEDKDFRRIIRKEVATSL